MSLVGGVVVVITLFSNPEFQKIVGILMGAALGMVGFGFAFIVIRLFVDWLLSGAEKCGCCRGRAYRRKMKEREAAEKLAMLAQKEEIENVLNTDDFEMGNDDLDQKDDGPGSNDTWRQKWDDATGKYTYVKLDDDGEETDEVQFEAPSAGKVIDEDGQPVIV
jgi:hypothetical protein